MLRLPILVVIFLRDICSFEAYQYRSVCEFHCRVGKLIEDPEDAIDLIIRKCIFQIVSGLNQVPVKRHR